MTDETLEVYNAKAQEYATLTQTTGSDKHLARFCKALAPGAYVLDLGCGPGFASAHLVSKGFKVDPTDGSSEMVKVARDQGNLPARQALFDDINEVEVYDGIWANFSLLHAPKSKFPDHLAALARALKPRGILHLGMKLGEGSAPDAIGRFYAYYTEAELKEHVIAAGFAQEYEAFGEDLGLAGTLDPWIILQARLVP